MSGHGPAIPMTSRKSGALKGVAEVPGDKSISHRSLILGALSVGETRISGLLEGQDVLDTGRAMQAFGAEVTNLGDGNWSVKAVTNGQLSDDVEEAFLSLFSVATTLIDKLDHSPAQENTALRINLMRILSVLMNPEAPIHQDTRFKDMINAFAQLVNDWDNRNLSFATSLSQLFANIVQDQGEALFSSNPGEKRYAIIAAKEWKFFNALLTNLKAKEPWRLESCGILAQFHALVVNKENLVRKTRRSSQNIGRFIDSSEDNANRTNTGFKVGGLNVEIDETGVNFIDALQFLIEACTNLLETMKVSISGYVKDGENRILLTPALQKELDIIAAALPYDDATVFTALMQGARTLLVVFAQGLLGDFINPNG